MKFKNEKRKSCGDDRWDLHEKSWRERKQIARTYFTQQSKSNISRPPTHNINPLRFLSTSSIRRKNKKKKEKRETFKKSI